MRQPRPAHFHMGHVEWRLFVQVAESPHDGANRLRHFRVDDGEALSGGDGAEIPICAYQLLDEALPL